MKLKNIKVGDFIEAKNKHGGDIGFDVLEVGKSYEVLGFNEGSDLSVIIAVPNHKTFHDGLYVSHECFRKPKPKPKQLDQSIFKEWDDCWKFFATDEDGKAWRYREEPKIDNGDNRWSSSNTVPLLIGTGYDATNWKNSLIKREPVPQFKQLNQSVFNGLDEKWRFAAVDRSGLVKAFTYEPKLSVSRTSFILLIGNTMDIGTGYDASNWQYSLIERDDLAKELLEIDLSKELTGSELCKAMLARGDKYVMCLVGTHNDAVIIEGMHGNEFVAVGMRNLYRNPKPINNQGEPLTASDVGI